MTSSHYHPAFTSSGLGVDEMTRSQKIFFPTFLPFWGNYRPNERHYVVSIKHGLLIDDNRNSDFGKYEYIPFLFLIFYLTLI